jgi:hypothetical protein
MGGARYFWKVLLTAFGVIALHFGVLMTVQSRIPAEYWIREFKIVKHWQIAQMHSPKLVFLGGSSTLFGIDAAQVEKALGVPAYNYGLHAGLRLEDLLELARGSLQPGDVLVISLEPPYYGAQGMGWTEWQLRNELAWNHQAFDRLPFLQRLLDCASASNPQLSFDILHACFLPMLDPKSLRPRDRAMAPESVILARYQARKRPAKEFAFDVSDLDEHGDILNATGKSGPLPAVFLPNQPSVIQPDVKLALKDFVGDMRRLGVSVYFDYTPYLVAKPPGVNWRDAELVFDAEIHSIGSEVLETRDRFFYPRSLLFDNPLHLNTQGRSLRTQRLIEAIRPKIPHQ